jgi:K+-transporting ATPase KdpF subunit
VVLAGDPKNTANTGSEGLACFLPLSSGEGASSSAPERYLNGRSVSGPDGRLLPGVVGLRRGLRSAVVGADMTALYALGGLISLGLLVYLFVALLKPEWF